MADEKWRMEDKGEDENEVEGSKEEGTRNERARARLEDEMKETERHQAGRSSSTIG